MCEEGSSMLETVNNLLAHTMQNYLGKAILLPKGCAKIQTHLPTHKG